MESNRMLPMGTVLRYPCADCGKRMILKWTQYGYLYQCVDMAGCGARHGCHQDTGEPFGYPGDEETRRRRHQAHVVFDQLWRGLHYGRHIMGREEAYQWLGKMLGLRRDEAHIAKLTADQCERIIRQAKKLLGKTTKGQIDQAKYYRSTRARHTKLKKSYDPKRKEGYDE